MASSFEKSVKGGTKIKLAPPKSKYVEHILVATHAGEAGVGEIFRALQNRLRDTTWTVVFKSLIIIHLMIREGEPDVTLKFMSHSPSRKLAINHFTEAQTQGRNIRTYSEYLLERARAYGQTKVDYVRGGEGRLKRLSVDKGLLRETEAVQNQIKALVQCELFQDEPENEITLVAFRLLTMDLLVLFHIMNEGTINVLEHYFEMSHPDAERALRIYRTFCKQTELVVQYLSIARLHEHSTRLEIPKIKHAPTSLAKSLEEYLNAPDFETSRRQYLIAKDAKKGSKAANGTNESAGASRTTPARTETKATQDARPTTAGATQQAIKPGADLIDFFDSIEQNQQPMVTQAGQPQQFQTPFPYQRQQQQQQSGFQQQSGLMQQPNVQEQLSQHGFATNAADPFGQPQQVQQVQQSFTGAGFGGYTHQPQQQFNPQGLSLQSIPQNGMVDFSQQQQQQQQQQQHQFQNPVTSPGALQPQSTNPFRQSMLPTQTGGLNPNLAGQQNTAGLSRSPTNPFARNPSPTQQQVPNVPHIPQAYSNTSMQAPQPSPFVQPQQPQSLLPTQTGTNPFARNSSPSQASSSPVSTLQGLMPNPTGTTNPFRQSMFVNQQTGQGWQSAPGQGTMGGLEQLPTMPVFPRPGQQPPQQPQGGWQ
ncbi:ANTH-domain-containing protein [Pseudovirgaria hyperparasitica]|uniref:ANTH-domain-containing protein n=1 Tax=Pseudovirgaria hyperparasitica TaxID=470096 RepID=A0A6A6VXU0_9PEZI|nr:ANTH-domain-containing protein [Pseudovirgaria hyperparasitica]KAF2755053.1 ANTH-domain-containing protein [Pseudovirgaria hyperparasitica]